MSESRSVMLVATHTPAEVPDDGFYMPIQVGAALADSSLGFRRDDDGENISSKNASYCELTGVYWAWRNLDADVVGLSHYRRYFVGEACGPDGAGILSAAEADALLADHDIVVGRPRNYVIETVDAHYRHAHVGSDIDVLRSVIQDGWPDDLAAFDAVFSGRKLSLYNMFLMRRSTFDAYASWLFGVLSRAEERIDNSSRTPYQTRTFGYLGERLLNVWMRAHADELRVRQRKIVNTQGEPIMAKALGLVGRRLGMARGR